MTDKIAPGNEEDAGNGDAGDVEMQDTQQKAVHFSPDTQCSIDGCGNEAKH